MASRSDAPISRLHALVPPGALRAVFQPIVDLDSSAVVGYEALARGPVGSALERPVDLFAAARAAGCLGELDSACREESFRAAVASGLLAPLTLFVNVEPEVLDGAPLDELVEIASSAPRELRVVFEVTERAIAARPAELLRTVERIRARGWAVALDDVGADPKSLAFMSLLRPEVVKLDLRLIQERPNQQIAAIMHAVNAYTEESGALLLAEGIETPAHADAARALGARFAQGWLFGRPGEEPSTLPIGDANLPRVQVELSSDRSPFACLAPGTPLRRAGKRLLIELSKKLEQEAMTHGETAIVTAAFQESRHFTALTAMRYERLAEQTAFVCALGEGLSLEPSPGVRGAQLAHDDVVVGEWDVIVLAPHFAAALLARDLGDSGPDLERRFEYALTYRRDSVVRAACALLSRVAPAVGEGATPARLAEAA
jgi:EAL domain-containing protein (putative c-di-GMP-specific phosphodiesterase class I)